MSEIIKNLNQIFIDIFDNDTIVLSPETTAKDIEEWDSLTNIQLIFAIEKHFNIRFSSKEIQNFRNIEHVCSCIEERQKETNA